MKDIVETIHLEFDKSAFLIDLVKHDSGSLYIEITQIINSNNKVIRSLRINPSVLPDVIKALQYYQAKLPMKSDQQTKYLTEEDQQKIQDRYLVGVPLKELVLQFDQSEELLAMVLRNRGVRVVPNERPRFRRYRKRKR